MADNLPTPFDQGLFLVHLNRGKENFERRNFAEAERELEEARRMRPDDQRVLNLLGLVYFRQEKYRQASEIYRLLIQASPDSLALHFNHGLICFKLGNLDQAEAAFLRALEIKPDVPKFHFYLGNIYERKKQYYNAIFQYRKAGANIMVKRVESKIVADQAGSAEVPAGEPQAKAESEQDQRLREELVEKLLGMPPEPSSPPGDETSPAIDHKVTVNHIDKERFLTTLKAREELQAQPAEAKSEQAARARPTAREETGLGSTEIPPAGRTLIRHTDPVIADEPLSEPGRPKTLSSAGASLFSPRDQAGERRGPERGKESPDLALPPVVQAAQSEPIRSLRVDRRGAGPEAEGAAPPRLFSQLRRRDDSFRYLENNLMEVNFSGKVFIKQGTIYSYSGNLTFWVKPQQEEAVPALVIVSGTGKLLLSDMPREITVLQISGEEIFVEPSHLLACQDTLTPRYATIEKEGSAGPRLHVLSVKGEGMIALSVATRPLLLTVTPDYPVNVSSASIISWSGELSPTIVEDEALAELMLPQTRRAVNLRLEGTGRVMMEKSTP